MTQLLSIYIIDNMKSILINEKGGESACVSPANFDAEVGKKIAFDNAVEKIWALEGYALRERLNGPLTAIGEGYARKVAEDLMGGKN